jgi:hypothetical protein
LAATGSFSRPIRQIAYVVPDLRATARRHAGQY